MAYKIQYGFGEFIKIFGIISYDIHKKCDYRNNNESHKGYNRY